MKEYKVVPCQAVVLAKSEEAVSKEFSKFAGIIEQEVYDGWQLVSTMPITVDTSKRMRKSRAMSYNALIFEREVLEKDDTINLKI